MTEIDIKIDEPKTKQRLLNLPLHTMFIGPNARVFMKIKRYNYPPVGILDISNGFWEEIHVFLRENPSYEWVRPIKKAQIAGVL